MKRIKKWLYEKFLPAWCREELLEDNAKLQARIESQAEEIRELRAYISGMEAVLRRQSRISIYPNRTKEANEP